MSDIDRHYKNKKIIAAKIPEADTLTAYYEQYAQILKKYDSQIQFIYAKLEEIRNERTVFISEKIPEIRRKLTEQQISEAHINDWLNTLVQDTLRSLSISETMLNAFYVKKMDEFRKELAEKMAIGSDTHD